MKRTMSVKPSGEQTVITMVNGWAVSFMWQLKEIHEHMKNLYI